MLNLINITKTYKIGDIETKALSGVNVAFRDKEFVAILGPSGSGKTTCLNIIGGLDRYDSGEITIKGKKTKDFKDKDWDAYRNNSIGFVFQSYNLISHLSIVANVELSMTLSGVPSGEKRERAIKALEAVGLKDHLHKKPNQLSGGQMQRVAIARALVNNPEILLCDEPTGALDTATSVQIMNLVKDIAKDRLVIMVTHNPELATEYADRIIQFKDGNIVSDTHPHVERPKEDKFNLKKTSMSFLTALNLSFNNIMTKKGRTFLTSFASSIGIIGIAVILSLSSGFQTKIDEFQSDAMAEFPIIVSKTSMNLDTQTMQDLGKQAEEKKKMDSETITSKNSFTIYDSTKSMLSHNNVITDDYLDYIAKIDKDVCGSIGYARLVNMNLLKDVDGKVQPVAIKSGFESMATSSVATSSEITSMDAMRISSYPTQLDKAGEGYLQKHYDVLAGRYPSKKTELVLVVDKNSRVDQNAMKSLGFNIDAKSMKFSDIVGTEFKTAHNDDYYVKTSAGSYLPNMDYKKIYDSKRSVSLKVVGVIREKADSKINILAPGLAYSDELSQYVIERALGSKIVKAQTDSKLNVLTMQEMGKDEKNFFLSMLGGNKTPLMIMIYPKDFEGKDKVSDYLDAYNKDKKREDKVLYSDLAETISTMTSGIMDGITLVLIAFAAISLIVSLIMIAIITYTSVLERTKEIGILKALGARKKDITRVFDAETCILGVFSGVLGISIAYLCTLPINSVIYHATKLEHVAQLKLSYAVTLVIISTTLTIIGGHIPARMASKMDAVEALRSE